MAFIDGLSSFLTTWSGVHTAYSFNQTNANTGTDTAHDANSSSYAQADTENYPNYGLAAYCSPDASGDMDIYIITDVCMLLYIPANLATDEYALFHNGGGTNGQMGQIRSENNGETITLGITHNIPSGQNYTTKVITERGWVCVGFQFEDNSGNMAIWVNGVNVSEVSRSYAMAYGSGNPKIGDGSADGIPGWTACEEIDGTGMLIANFVCDNPNNDNSNPAGCGDSFYTDYYNAHVSSEEEHSGTASISGNGSQSGSVEKGGKVAGLISGAGTLIVAVAIGLFGAGVISGNGSQVASGTKAAVVSASISGGGTLAATGEVGAEDYEGTAAISGSGSLVASGKAGFKQASIISGNGTLSGSIHTNHFGAGIVSGAGSITVIGQASVEGIATISGNGTITATWTKASFSSASIVGGGVLMATGQKPGGTPASKWCGLSIYMGMEL